MVEYLVRLLSIDHKTAVLSRGYGRSSTGFKLATPNLTAEELGDEPLQMYLKFHPAIQVAVGESRALAIPSILLEEPGTELVILDDAFQHREVNPDLSILVTDYRTPFFRDHVLPAGRLREFRSGARRADIIVVTKCPSGLEPDHREQYRNGIKKYNQQAPVYFTRIIYQDPIHCSNSKIPLPGSRILLLTGIAKPKTMVEYVSDRFTLVDHISYRDHFRYQKKHIDHLIKRFGTLGNKCDAILTTEKDMVRLKKFESLLDGLPIYYLPIECQFIGDGQQFNQSVLNRLRNVKIDG
ncbi:MAG: tetraacyldisaccharide 4'-kinase [Cyclobacteriaceae bacterium]|nr:MAG: tetraacyldisaccharide 4'-kinase [Cyclobacteriaceae bacterium]